MTTHITCKGCWKIVALGISTRSRQVIYTDSEGEVKAVVEQSMPAHGTEVCPDCGAEYDCGDLEGWVDRHGNIVSESEAREKKLSREQFVYRGFIEGEVSVNDPMHYLLPDVDEQREQWLPAKEDRLEEQWL